MDLAGRGAVFDEMLEIMLRAWKGEVSGAGGRMARLGGGWVAPLYGFDEYIHHYYGDEFFDAARADVLTTPAHLRRELERLRDAGCDDVLLFPCTANLDQPRRLAAVLDTPARES